MRINRHLFFHRLRFILLGILISVALSPTGCSPQSYSAETEAYTQQLRDKNAVVRYEAAANLGRIGPDAQGSVPELIESLEDENPFVRLSAATALGKIHAHPEITILALVERLNQEAERRPRQAAADALIRFGTEAVQPLIKVVQNNDDRNRQLSAIHALEQIGPDAKMAIPALEKVMQNGDGFYQTDAIDAIGYIGLAAKDSIPLMFTALEAPAWDVRASAARSLGNIGASDPPVIEALINTLSDSDAVVRQRTTEALGKLGTEAIPTLTQFLLDKTQQAEARGLIAYALGDMGPDVESAIPDLVKALDDVEVVQDGVAIALESIGMSAVPALTEVLSHPNKNVRNASVSIIDAIAGDLESRIDPLGSGNAVLSDLSKTELETALPALMQAQRILDQRISESNVATNSLGEPPFSKEIVDSLRKSVAALAAHKQARFLRTILNGIFSIAAVVGMLCFGIFWFQPVVLLRASKALVNAKQENQLLQQWLSTIRRFFEDAGATVQSGGKQTLTLNSASGRLKPLAPLPVLFSSDQPTVDDVTDLMRQADRLHKGNSKQAGLLLYREPPDTLFRVRMAEVRLRDRFILIPIPFAAVEKAVVEPGASAGLLAQYSDRYLPGADLFNDRNAIGDTLSFFGRSELLNRLEEEFQRGQGIGLFGLRKSGKTSILLQLGFALRHHPIVHLDLQPYGGRLYYGAELFNTICQQLVLLIRDRNESAVPHFESFPIDQPATAITTEFMQRIGTLYATLQQVGYASPILLFLDEIERILPMSVDSSDRVVEFNAFFGSLRALIQEKRQLGLLVADVHPDCNRINQWEQEGVPTNPVFNFFKELFLSPFSPEETNTMLVDISRLMGRSFDPKTLSAIHTESGGHPFIARQLASLLCSKIPAQDNDNDMITWSAAKRYIERPFAYSGVLKDYFSQNIWADLQKREFDAAMAILNAIASNKNMDEGVTDSALQTVLGSSFSESQYLDALLWLEMVGLMERQEHQDGDSYRGKIALLSRWRRMEMGEEEQQKWHIQ